MFILLGNNSSEIISNNALTDDKPFNQRVKERMNEIPVQARYAYSIGEALAIPVGVPSNYIVGIILGGQYTEEELKNIRKIFPDTAIISHEGKVLYEGKRVVKDVSNILK